MAVTPPLQRAISAPSELSVATRMRNNCCQTIACVELPRIERLCPQDEKSSTLCNRIYQFIVSPFAPPFSWPTVRCFYALIYISPLILRNFVSVEKAGKLVTHVVQSSMGLLRFCHDAELNGRAGPYVDPAFPFSRFAWTMFWITANPDFLQVHLRR